MSSRAAPSGINKDIQDKKNAKYPTDLEVDARKWIETVLEKELKDREIGAHHFAESLKSGEVLCQLINKLCEFSGVPGVKKVNSSTMVFKQMENISNFLSASEKYGVPKESLFQTVDLYEERDVGSVVTFIFTLAGVARKKNYPTEWGIAVTDPNKRQFSEEQLAAGKNIISLQAGTNKGANQAGISFGSQRKM